MIYVKDKSHLVSLDFLSGLPFPPFPEQAGKRWKGVPHHSFLVHLSEEVRKYGTNLSPFSIYYKEFPEGSSDLVAVCDLSHRQAKIYDKETSFCLGVRNDNSGDSRLMLYLGIKFLEEEVGFPLFCYPLGKHDSSLDWKKEIRDNGKVLVANLCYLAHKRITKIRKIRLTERKMKDLLWLGCRRKWVCWSSLGFIDRKMLMYPDHQWNLFYLMKEISKEGKKGPPLQQMSRNYAFLSWASGEGLKTLVDGGNDPTHAGRKIR